MQEPRRDGPAALYGRKQLKGSEANFVFYYVLDSVDPATAHMVAVVRAPVDTRHRRGLRAGAAKLHYWESSCFWGFASDCC